MAWKSYYLAAGVVRTAAFPFYSGFDGGGNLPQGACIVVANHSSFLDGPLLTLAYCQARLKPLHMIAYEEPFNHPVMGWILRSGGSIPFKRNDRKSQGTMLSAALGWLGANEAVGIFPEGHINIRPRLNRARPGAAMLALETGLPLVPTAIVGSGKILPPGSFLPRRAPRARVMFGRPMPLLEKELRYRDLPAEERKVLIVNLGYRIMRAIGMLTGRKWRE